MASEQEILRYLSKQPRHMAGFKQMIHDLGLKGRARPELHNLLKEMTRRRAIVAIGDDRWSLPTTATSQNLITGRLHMHRDGYGFVTPDSGSVPQSKLQGDVFIPPPQIGNAMHGDQVLVELGRVRHDGKAEGRIVRVTERQQETIVGTFHYGHRHNFVTPIEGKIAQEIVIPQGMDYPPAQAEPDEDANNDSAAAVPPSAADRSHKHARRRPHEGKSLASTPHRVLGSEVKPKDWDDLENVVVEVEIIQWPTATQNPRGRVTVILGKEDDFGVDVEIIIRKHHIRHLFPAAVLEEAQAVSAVIPHREIERRRDFRDLPIVTIDGETARDFDDAVFVRRLDGGRYELHVHIADVSHYVQDGSALDAEARRRGTSVYFPDRAVPMLPLELSTDICSLRPESDRLVMSCVMTIDPQGEVEAYELAEGVIRSAHRMTYTDVNSILEGDAVLRRRYSDMADSFDLMRELAQVLNRKRVKRGSIDFDLPEAVIEFDDFGLMQSISPSERNWAHRLIEEFMLTANETVAAHLESRVASIYRIHEKPDPKRIYDFETIAASFGYSLGVGALPVKRVQFRSDRRSHYGSGRRAPTLELPEEVHVTPRMYQKLVQKIAGKPEERVLSYLMLRSLKQARYSEVNEGHFALAAPAYTHFTSPIRRYPDLIVHRILREVLRDDSRDRGPQAPGSPERAGFARAGVEVPSPAHEELEADERFPVHLRSRKVDATSPWSKRRAGQHQTRVAQPPPAVQNQKLRVVAGLSEIALHEIASSCSQTERAAAEAERELLEWKKLKFMQDRLGEEFDGLIVSVTKFGFFVELTELFIEGLVPLDSLEGDHFAYHENTRQIIGGRTRKTYTIGAKIRVLADRIDHLQRRINFAVVEETPKLSHPARNKQGKTKRR